MAHLRVQNRSLDSDGAYDGVPVRMENRSSSKDEVDNAQLGPPHLLVCIFAFGREEVGAPSVVVCSLVSNIGHPNRPS